MNFNDKKELPHRATGLAGWWKGLTDARNQTFSHPVAGIRAESRVRLIIPLLLLLLARTTPAADRTWTGSAKGDGNWTNPANWGGMVPANFDALYFSGTNSLLSTNNFPGTNVFASLIFKADAGSFILRGTGLALTGGITNYSKSPQTNNLALEVGNLVVLVTNAGTLLLNGTIASTNGSLAKFGSGTLVLNASNTYPGGTIIRQGTVQITTAGRLGAPGGPLFMNGGTLEIGNLLTLANRAVTLDYGGGTFRLDQISYLTVTNDISGPGALIKTGPGALILNNAVTSTGPVAVQEGTLYVDGIMSGPPTVMVYSGGVLGGNGLISGDLTIQDGGTLAPGTNDVRGPSTLTVSNLMLNPNSIVRMDLNVPGVMGGSNDLLIVHGHLTLDGILKVDGNGTNGVYPIIQYDNLLTDAALRLGLGMEVGPAVNGTLTVDPVNRTINLNAISFPPAPPTPMRLFFVGNSLTFYYDIPGTVAGMAAANNDWFSYRSDLVSGSTLQDHSSNQTTLALMDSGDFDLVMLQEYSDRSTIPHDRDNLMYPVARNFNARITSHGQKTMFYETWGYPGGDPGPCFLYDTPMQYRGCGNMNMLIAVRMGYARIANELNAAISPVGLAWQTVQTEHPELNLYYDNLGNYHPNPAGAYLAACVHYAAIFGRSPVANSCYGYLTDPALAAYLQSVAERTVLQDPWASDPFGFAPNRYYWACRWGDYTNHSFSRLSGVVISGNGGLPSPSVKLDSGAGTTNNLYLGVFGYNYESAGQGRLFIKPGGSLVLTNDMVVGKEGQSWVQQDGGTLQVNGVLRLAEQPSSSGCYTLAGGFLNASRIAAGLGDAAFNFTGGQLSFAKFGAATNSLSLVQTGGTLAPSNAATLYGDYAMSDSATLALVLGHGTNSLALAGGDATLGGTLSLSYAPGFVPSPGQQFTLLTANTLSGRFKRVTGPWPMPGGVALVLNYTSNAVVASTVNGLTDSNTNGLPDWWQVQYFGSANSGQTWGNSFLGDGIPNGIKYALYADPTAGVPPNLLPQATLANGYLILTYRQHLGGSGLVGIDYTMDRVLYRVEVTDDLARGLWVSGTNYVQATGSRIDNGDGTETVSVRIAQPASLFPRRFARLSITQAGL